MEPQPLTVKLPDWNAEAQPLIVKPQSLTVEPPHLVVKSKTPAVAPLPWYASLEKLCAVLASPQRCRILRELTKHEWLPVSHLAMKAGISRTAASQHMAILLSLKIVGRGIGRLYRLAPALRPAPGTDWIDFGHLCLRLTSPPQPVQ